MLKDATVAWRAVRRAPTISLVAVGCFALTVGANATILGLADALLFRPLPFEAPERLFVLRMLNTRTGTQSSFVPGPYLQQIVEHIPADITIGLREARAVVPRYADADAEWVTTTTVEHNYFRVLGLHAARGRLFDESDAKSGGSVVVTDRGWRERLGASASVVGRTITLGKSTRDVIGVLPSGFMFPARYVPSSALIALDRPQCEYVFVAQANPRRQNFDPVVRLAAGTTVKSAEERIQQLVATQRQQSKDPASIPVLVDLRSVVFPTGREMVRVLAVGAVLVLLIGCANIAILVLAATRVRARSIGIHVALGATPFRIVRLVLLETALIAGVGSLVALFLAKSMFAVVVQHVPPQVYGDALIGIDWRVVAITCGLAALSAIGSGVLPAMAFARLDVQSLLYGRRWYRAVSRWHFPAIMIGLQVSLASVLVFAAGSMARTLVSSLRTSQGFSAAKLITAAVEPLGADSKHFYAGLLSTLKERQDVVDAGAASYLPLSGGVDDFVAVAGQQTAVGIVHVLPGYHESIGQRLLSGRFLSGEDVNNPTVTVVSESAARVLFGEARASIGQTVVDTTGKTFTVVGVVSDVLWSPEPKLDRPVVYTIPIGRSDQLTLVVRVRDGNQRVIADLRRAINAVAPSMPVNIGYWADALKRRPESQIPRLETWVLGGFGVLALALAAIGVFGTVGAAVAGKTREIAIRVALGARPNTIRALFLARALVPVFVGLVGGLVGSLLLRSVVERQLVGVRMGGLSMYVATAFVVVVAATVAALGPTSRVTRVEPNSVLRSE